MADDAALDAALADMGLEEEQRVHLHKVYPSYVQMDRSELYK
jgi:hypothetical protein